MNAVGGPLQRRSDVPPNAAMSSKLNSRVQVASRPHAHKLTPNKAAEEKGRTGSEVTQPPLKKEQQRGTAAAAAALRPLSRPKPRRPLTAYNLFFKQEREKIVASDPDSPPASLSGLADTANGLLDRIIANGGGLSPVKEGSNGNEADSSAAGDGGAPGSRSRDRRRAAHGRIGFAELARTISRKWKSLDESSRSVFEALALLERKRYERELEIWNRERSAEFERQAELLGTKAGEVETRLSAPSKPTVPRKRRLTPVKRTSLAKGDGSELEEEDGADRIKRKCRMVIEHHTKCSSPFSFENRSKSSSRKDDASPKAEPPKTKQVLPHMLGQRQTHLRYGIPKHVLDRAFAKSSQRKNAKKQVAQPPATAVRPVKVQSRIEKTQPRQQFAEKSSDIKMESSATPDIFAHVRFGVPPKVLRESYQQQKKPLLQAEVVQADAAKTEEKKSKPFALRETKSSTSASSNAGYMPSLVQMHSGIASTILKRKYQRQQPRKDGDVKQTDAELCRKSASQVQVLSPMQAGVSVTSVPPAMLSTPKTACPTSSPPPSNDAAELKSEGKADLKVEQSQVFPAVAAAFKVAGKRAFMQQQDADCSHPVSPYASTWPTFEDAVKEEQATLSVLHGKMSCANDVTKTLQKKQLKKEDYVNSGIKSEQVSVLQFGCMDQALKSAVKIHPDSDSFRQAFAKASKTVHQDMAPTNVIKLKQQQKHQTNRSAQLQHEKNDSFPFTASALQMAEPVPIQEMPASAGTSAKNVVGGKRKELTLQSFTSEQFLLQEKLDHHCCTATNDSHWLGDGSVASAVEPIPIRPRALKQEGNCFITPPVTSAHLMGEHTPIPVDVSRGTSPSKHSDTCTKEDAETDEHDLHMSIADIFGTVDSTRKEVQSQAAINERSGMNPVSPKVLSSAEIANNGYIDLRSSELMNHQQPGLSNAPPMIEFHMLPLQLQAQKTLSAKMISKNKALGALSEGLSDDLDKESIEFLMSVFR